MNRVLRGVLVCCVSVAFAGLTNDAAAAAGVPRLARLRNLSARAEVRSGEDVLIGGFIIGGTAPKTILLRAIGASLVSNGAPFPGRLLDPTLTLVREGSAIPSATNDNWKDNDQALILARELAPSNE